MSEFGPTSSPELDKERSKLAEKRAELERQELVLGAAEAFGKYDTNPQPAEGELTYEQYLEQRPKDGIVREGTKFRDSSGNFASQEAYEQQQAEATAQDTSYNGRIEAAIRSNEGKVFESPYESLGLMQLAKEYSLAGARQDRTAQEDIREALEHKLTMEAMHDDSLTSEEAQARYDADLGRFESLVTRFGSRPDAQSQKAEEAHIEPNGEGAPSAREAVQPVDEAAQASQPGQELELYKNEPVTIVNQESRASKEQEPGGYYNGKKVSVARVGFGDGKDAILTVVDEAGEVSEIRASELTYEAQPEVKVVEPQKETSGNQEAAPEAPKVGTTLELYRGEVDSQETKKWWTRAGDQLRRFGGAAYWKEKFSRAEAVPDDSLNRGVVEQMPEQERDTRRNRNRYVAILATAALLAPTFLMGAVGAKSGENGERNNAETSTSAGATPGEAEQDITEPVTPEVTPVVNLPLSGAEGAGPTTIPEAEIPNEQINVVNGQGGYELFASLGLDAAAWDANAQTLATNFPQDFYREGNEVRLMAPGQLSQGAQDFINTLRQG